MSNGVAGTAKPGGLMVGSQLRLRSLSASTHNRLHVETIGSGGMDEPSGNFPNLSMSWKPAYTKKRTLRADRLAEGAEPYCVSNCPSEALLHGNLAEGAARAKGATARCR